MFAYRPVDRLTTNVVRGGVSYKFCDGLWARTRFHEHDCSAVATREVAQACFTSSLYA